MYHIVATTKTRNNLDFFTNAFYSQLFLAKIFHVC